MLVTSNNVFCVISVSSIVVYSVFSPGRYSVLQNIIKSSVAISSSLLCLLLVVICLSQIVPEQFSSGEHDLPCLYHRLH